MHTTRRQFVVGSAAGLLGASLRAQTGALTVQQIADRIRTSAPAPGRGSSDGLKAGDPATVVTGITVVSMATLGLLTLPGQHPNLIVTLEPTFYSANDEPGPRANDPVLLAKKQAIADRHLAVYRISDQWAGRFAPAAAVTIAAVHKGRPVAGVDRVFDIPDTSLRNLAIAHASGGLRVVGNEDMRVKRIFISPGGTTLQATMNGLKDADAAIVGEPREWEGIPYVLDTLETASPKGMVYLGRIVSENAGLQACVEWLKGLVPEVPVGSLSIPDPYWTVS